MKPYSSKRKTKGLAGCRKSKASPHRKRCLRVDKRTARQTAKKEIKSSCPTWLYERMEKLKKLPPPSLEDVTTSFRASEKWRKDNEKKDPISFPTWPPYPI